MSGTIALVPWRRLLPVILAAAALAPGALAAGGAGAETSWPPRATPMGSTRGWFRAINAHDRRRLLWYVAPRARNLMGWARPSVSWSKFTDLHCWRNKSLTRGQVRISCTFHESASPTEGNPDSRWDVYLEHKRGVWLIVNYGQG